MELTDKHCNLLINILQARYGYHGIGIHLAVLLSAVSCVPLLAALAPLVAALAPLLAALAPLLLCSLPFPLPASSFALAAAAFTPGSSRISSTRSLQDSSLLSHDVWQGFGFEALQLADELYWESVI